MNPQVGWIVQQSHSAAATAKIIEFLLSNCIFIKARELIAAQGGATFAEICTASAPEYAFLSIDEQTLQQYNRRILAYCRHFGLLSKNGMHFVLGDPVFDIMESAERVANIREVDIFRAAAPPERVIELVDQVRGGVCKTKKEAESQGLRNAVFAASTLGLIVQQNGEISIADHVKDDMPTSMLVRQALVQIEPFKSSLAEIEYPGLPASELGAIIADLYGLNWSTGSCERHGSAIKRWTSWMAQ